MYVGSCIHNFCEDMEKLIISGGELPTVEKGQEIILQEMRDGFKNSKEGNYWKLPKSTALFEHEYKVDVSKEDWAKIKEKAIICVENFLTMPFVKKMFSKPKDWLEIEQLSKISVGEIPVWVKMDFSAIIDGKIHVVDYKTGKHSEDVKDQLSLYAMYAAQKWGHKNIEIIATEVNLFSGKTYEYKITQEDMRVAEKRIIDSTNDMRSLLINIPKNEPMDEECFEPTEKKWTCMNCNYRAICPVSLV